MPRRKTTSKAKLIAALLKSRKPKARTRKTKRKGVRKAKTRSRRGRGLVGGMGISDLYNVQLERALQGRGGADKILKVVPEDGGYEIKYIEDPMSTPYGKELKSVAKELEKAIVKAQMAKKAKSRKAVSTAAVRSILASLNLDGVKPPTDEDTLLQALMGMEELKDNPGLWKK